MTLQSPGQKRPDPQSQHPQPHIPLYWWIVLMGLMIWNATTYLKSSAGAGGDTLQHIR